MQFEPAKTFERLEPLTIPNLKPIETDSVPKKQSLYEWGMAGGGVPLQYKDREHEWHAMVNKHEAKMAGGGLLKKAMKGVQKVLPVSERDANLAKMLEGSKVKERVYHGTGNLESLKSFDPAMTGKGTDQLGSGFYFTTNPEEASGYATTFNPPHRSGASGKIGGNSSPGVIPAHLSLKKPIKVKGSNLTDSDASLSQKQALEMIRRAPNIRHAEDTPLHDWFDLSRSGGVTESMLRDVAKNYQGSSLNSLSNDFYRDNPSEFRSALRDVTGYDGVMQDFGDGRKHYVAWFPEQIKSDIGNRGTYDVEDADINKAGGGAIHLKKGGDPRNRGMFPKMSTQAIMESPGFDPEIPSDLSRAYARRMAEKEAYERSMRDQKLTPAQRATAALETAGMLGSAAFEGIQQLPKLLDGEDAYSSAVGSRMYQPRFQPEKAGEYAGNVVDFLEQLETKYKVPALVPELLPFATAANVAKSQAQSTAKKAVSGLDVLKGSKSEPKGSAAQRGVIKMPGGNFLTGRVEKDLKPLRQTTGGGMDPDEALAQMSKAYPAGSITPDVERMHAPVIQRLKTDSALNKWVDSNLSNYIKKQMGTPEDPVRALAEQGITHKRNLLDEYPRDAEGIKSERKAAGFPEEGMGQSPMAQAWERASDESLATHRAGDIQEMPERFTKGEEAQAKMVAAREELDKKFMKHIEKAGLNEKETANLLSGYPYTEKAKLVGDTAFLQANDEYRATQSPMMSSYIALGRENPWISKLDPETQIYSPFTGDLGFDHIMDVLRQDLTAGRIRPEQMNKISISDAVRRAHQYDEDMAKKMAEAQAKVTEGMPVHKEYPEGYKWIELNMPEAKVPEGATWEEYNDIQRLFGPKGESLSLGATKDEAIKLLNREERGKQLAAALKYEGDTMGHCVGGYCPDVLEGRTRIYSLRDAKGEPHVTVEVQPGHRDRGFFGDQRPTGDEYYSQMNKFVAGQNDGTVSPKVTFAEWWRANQGIPEPEALPPRIQQIKGKQNRAPKEEYLPYVQDFVKGGKWSDIGDLQNTGLRRTSDAFNEAEQEFLKSKGVELKPYIDPEETARYQELFKRTPDVPPEEGMAHGGEVHMQAGGLAKMLGKGLKAAKQASPLVEAPSIIVPKGVSSIKEAARQSKGEYGARRVERAADEIPNLEKMYNEQALRESFLGDNAKAVVTMNPANFERYAQILKGRTKDDIGPKMAELARQGEIDKYTVPIDEYIQHLMRVEGGFDQVPYLNLYKDEVGIPSMPEVRGHEGRHRSRALSKAGEAKSLVQINPGGDLREGLSRRSQEEYINALREELERSGRLVLPEGDRSYSRPAVEFPEPYAKGGLVRMGLGGLLIKKPVKAAAKKTTLQERATTGALPLRLPRAVPKSAAEINAHAERVARQMMGEHVTSGKKGDTANLAGRSKKESQRIKNLEYKLTSTKDVPESKVVESKIGDVNIAMPGDYTVSDVELESIMGEPVGSRQEGGSRYGLGHMEKEVPNFWASGEGPAQQAQDKITDIGEFFDPERVMAQHLAMGPVATNFAQHFADANLRRIDYSKFKLKDMLDFDRVIAGGFAKKDKKTGEVVVTNFPDWPGIADPQAAYDAMKENPELRKWFNSRMKTPEFTKYFDLPSGLDVQWAITHPELRNMEINLTGHSVGEMMPGASLTDTAEHNTYLKGIPGIYRGHQEVLTPFGISFPDATEHMIATQRPQDFTGTIQKVFPHQRVDQQYIDEISAYRKRIKELTGKKKGGAVGGLSAITKSPQLHD